MTVFSSLIQSMEGVDLDLLVLCHLESVANFLKKSKLMFRFSPPRTWVRLWWNPTMQYYQFMSSLAIPQWSFPLQMNKSMEFSKKLLISAILTFTMSTNLYLRLSLQLQPLLDFRITRNLVAGVIFLSIAFPIQGSSLWLQAWLHCCPKISLLSKKAQAVRQWLTQSLIGDLGS